MIVGELFLITPTREETTLKNHQLILCLMAAITPALLMTGCASVSTPMKHSDGRVVNCSAAGIGVIGAPAALIMRESCVSDARAKGFAPLDEPQPTTTAKSTSPYTGRVTISLPDGWVRKTPPAAYSSAIDFATNTTLGAYMVLSYVAKKDITDIGIFAETKKAAQLSKLRESSSTEMVRAEIKGRSVFSTDIEGIIPSNGEKYHFRNTILDGDTDIIMLSVWTPAANYSGRVKEQLDSISSGVSGI